MSEQVNKRDLQYDEYEQSLDGMTQRFFDVLLPEFDDALKQSHTGGFEDSATSHDQMSELFIGVVKDADASLTKYSSSVDHRDGGGHPPNGHSRLITVIERSPTVQLGDVSYMTRKNLAVTVKEEMDWSWGYQTEMVEALQQQDVAEDYKNVGFATEVRYLYHADPVARKLTKTTNWSVIIDGEARLLFDAGQLGGLAQTQTDYDPNNYIESMELGAAMRELEPEFVELEADDFGRISEAASRLRVDE